MASKTNILGRQSIHRDVPPGSPKSPNILTSDSQEELSDGYESNDAHNSDESLTEYPSEKAELDRRNQSKTKNSSIRSESDFLNKSAAKKVQRKSSFEPHSAIQPENSMEVQPSSCGNKFNFILYLIIIPVGLAFLIYAFGFSNEQKPKKVCSFKELQKKYPKEGTYLWNHLQIGSEDILNNESDKPAVYLFVHQNKEIARKLVNDIAQTAARCFDSSPIIKNIDFSSKEAIEDYGHIIAKYKETIEEGHVILIANLNEIPAEAAKALHAICDTITPLVKKVIILLSLTAERKNIDEKVVDTAETALNNLWKDKIKPHELDPIITRVTDSVLLLQSY